MPEVVAATDQHRARPARLGDTARLQAEPTRPPHFTGQEGLRRREGDGEEDHRLERPALPLHARAEALSIDLEAPRATLAETATDKTNALIAQNAARTRARGTSSSASRREPSSWRCCWGSSSRGRSSDRSSDAQSRLAEIAAGDFSGHVDVPTATSWARSRRTSTG